MGNAPSRTLLQLPKQAIKHVLISMEPEDLCLFSFCSKRSEGHVKALKLKSIGLSIQIDFVITFTLTIGNIDRFMISFYFEDKPQLTENGQKLKNMEKIEHIILSRRMPGVTNGLEISSPIMPLKGWLTHFLSIYNCSTIGCITIVECQTIFDNAMLCETFKGNNITRLRFHRLPVKRCYGYVSHVFPQATELIFAETPHTSTEFFHKIAVQNVEFISFLNFRIPLKVQDLTFIRIPQIEWFGCSLTVKEVNQFLKLWIAGENVELEHFCFIFEEGVIIDKEAVLQGVNYREMGLREMRNKMIRQFTGQSNHLSFSELIVQRQDMTEATISVETKFIRFIVWT